MEKKCVFLLALIETAKSTADETAPPISIQTAKMGGRKEDETWD